MRFFTVTALTALLSVSTYALPTADGVVARSAKPEAIAEALVEAMDIVLAQHIEARAGTKTKTKDIKYGANPTKDYTCPATNNGNHGDYAEHKYTSGQIKAAFIAGAKLNAAGKQIGAQNYPHKYNSNKDMPNDCGSQTQEFPIQTNNNVYSGGSVTHVPDRILYELKDGKTEITVKYCGVIRHGPGGDFLNCP